MSSVKAGVALGLFLLKAVLVFFLSGRFRVFKTFSWRGQRPQPLLFLLSVRGPEGTAPVDPCGHSQETSAPHLQIGSLPTPVRFRARAVSNCLGRPSSQIQSLSFSGAGGSGGRAHHEPAQGFGL